jgi:hypothetical protein
MEYKQYLVSMTTVSYFLIFSFIFKALQRYLGMRCQRGVRSFLETSGRVPLHSHGMRESFGTSEKLEIQNEIRRGTITIRGSFLPYGRTYSWFDVIFAHDILEHS